MPRPAVSTAPRRAANVTLPEALLRDAQEMGIDLSQACERDLTAELADARRLRWLEENREATAAWNDHVAKQNLLLAAFREF